MKVVVTGAAGMLGHMACRVLGARFDVIAATARELPPGHALRELVPASALAVCDVTDAAACAGLFARERPDAVINAAGVVKQRTDAGTARVVAVDALAPHVLAEACARTGARLVHASTDCVFSGARGGYREDDVPDPLDLYGRAKLTGEVAAPHLTLRTSFIGRELAGAHGLLEQVIAHRGGRMAGWGRARWSGLTSHALCTLVGELLAAHRELAGVYHVAGPIVTKLELVQAIEARLGLDIEVVPDDKIVLDRTLDGSRFVAATGLSVPSWDSMLDQLAADQPLYERLRG
jgi:dTDP-4-dehydrorhamnose reductase